MDNVLKNTLPALPNAMAMPSQKAYPSPGQPGGSQTYNEGVEVYADINNANLNSLQGAQRTSTQMADFQKIMSLASRQAYKERQATDISMAKEQFDPTKVSGGTFASIIGNLEQERSKDTKKIYGANMGGYRNIQNEINKRIEYLQDLKMEKEKFMMDYDFAKKTAKKDKDALKKLKAKKEMFNKDYIMGLQRAGSDTAYMDFTASEIQQSIQDLASQNYNYEQISGALLQEKIPTFAGSLAGDYLNTIFK